MPDRDQLKEALGPMLHVRSVAIDRREFLRTLAPAMALLRGFGRNVGELSSSADFLVTAYGARGNGRSDDTRAFLSAIRAATVKGGTVVVPHGHFRLRQALPVPSGVRIRGVGVDSALDWTSLTRFGIVLSSSVNAGVSSVRIGGALSWGILIEHARHISLDDCHVSGGTVAHGSYCGGVVIADSTLVRVAGGTFERNGTPGAPRGSDIQCNGYGNAPCSEVELVGNVCRSTDVAFNICCFDSNNVQIRQNRVSGARTGTGDNEGYGIVLYGTARNPTSCHDNLVADNDVQDTQGSGIYVVRGIRTRVEDNRIRRVGIQQDAGSLPVAGISLNDPAAVVVSGNEVADTRSVGIAVSVHAASNVATRVSTNSIVGADGAGIHLRGEVGGLEVSGNHLLDTRGGIVADAPGGQRSLIIRDNEIVSTRGSSAGIMLSAARGTRLERNMISDAGTFGIDVGDPDGDLVMAANRVSSHGRRARGSVPAVRIRRP